MAVVADLIAQPKLTQVPPGQTNYAYTEYLGPGDPTLVGKKLPVVGIFAAPTDPNALKQWSAIRELLWQMGASLTVTPATPKQLAPNAGVPMLVDAQFGGAVIPYTANQGAWVQEDPNVAKAIAQLYAATADYGLSAQAVALGGAAPAPSDVQTASVQMVTDYAAKYDADVKSARMRAMYVGGGALAGALIAAWMTP
jgi:hypothetical protein